MHNLTLAPVDLPLEEVLTDSPTIRASLQRNEDQLDELSSILDSVVKSSRNCLEHASSNTKVLDCADPILNANRIVRIDWEAGSECRASDYLGHFRGRKGTDLSGNNDRASRGYLYCP